MTIRSFRQLDRLPTFEARFDYLSVRNDVGAATFGFERYLNQRFYTSREWRAVRNIVLARDEGCDLGIPGHEIYRRPIIHHMNPMTIEDVDDGNPDILDPEFLITVSHDTHNAIHYGTRASLRSPEIERTAGDTDSWERRR